MFFKVLFPEIHTYATRALTLNTFKLNSLQVQPVPNVESVRYAARKGTRAARLAKKKAAKLSNQSKPKPIPRFIQRKVKVSSDTERKRCVDENWLVAKPIDDVYNMKLYRGKPYLFSEAIQMHKDSHVPTLINDPTSIVYTSIEMDLKLKKKDRYLERLSGILTFPHEFKSYRENRIIAICKDADEQTKAADAGAVNVGSTALIKQILSGVISKEEFDYIICHPDMLKEMNVLRGILANKFPTAHNALLRLDVANAVMNFKHSVEYDLKCSTIEPDFGWVDVPFGTLEMPLEHLEENFKFALDSVQKQKPMGMNNVFFIIRALICCPKSRESFKVAHWEYLPGYPENGIVVDVEESDDEAEKAA